VITLQFDLPLGHAAINRRYKFRHVLSDEWRQFQKDLADLARRTMAGRPPLKGEVGLFLDMGWTRERKSGPAKGLAFGDLDAPIKCIMDALAVKKGEGGGVYEDDAQVEIAGLRRNLAGVTIVKIFECTGHIGVFSIAENAFGLWNTEEMLWVMR
jgi:Endodeoxyribonuclease RusA